jgi:hypothetical protein
MTQHSEQRRRIDRITAPDYLDGLDARSPADLRAMRDDCRAEEARLSYERRLLQGKIDILRAEAARRDAGEGGGLVDALPSILADQPTGQPRGVRATPVYEPETSEQRRGMEAELEGVLARVPDMSDDELAATINKLVTWEGEVSGVRGEVLRSLDALQEELIRRYREGDLALDEILSPAGPPP